MKIIPKFITDNTLVDYPRLDVIMELIEKANELEGHFAEVGVYKGGTAALIGSLMDPYKTLFLFDTFTGMPKVRDVDLHQEGDFNDTSMDYVASLMDQTPANYAMHKGIFPRENSNIIENEKFSFVHLDVDIYDSVYECLEFFLPRMVSGGIIILDDYNAPTCPGAKLATDEFCQKNGLTLIPTVQSQAILKID